MKEEIYHKEVRITIDEWGDLRVTSEKRLGDGLTETTVRLEMTGNVFVLIEKEPGGPIMKDWQIYPLRCERRHRDGCECVESDSYGNGPR